MLFKSQKNNTQSQVVNNSQISNPKLEHAIKFYYVRTFFASIFGFIAFNLIIASILVFWLSNTINNTDKYVSTVAPLATKPAVQNYIADAVSKMIVSSDDLPIQDLASEILGATAIAGKSTNQIKAELSPVIKESVQQVVSSPTFTDLWTETNRTAHQQFINALNKKGNDVTLDLHPVIVGVVDELGKTKLAPVKDKLVVKNDVGKVTVKGKELDKVRPAYELFKKSVVPVISAALVLLVLSVLISVHHMKTLRRIALSVGISTGLLVLLLKTPSLIKVKSLDSSGQQLARTISDTLLHGLITILIVISVGCFVVAIGTKLNEIFKGRRRVNTLN